MRITFVQTGGTIDKDYPRSHGGYAFEFGEPAASRLLARWQPTFEFDLHTAFQKDSTELTDADRTQLAALIRDDASEHVGEAHAVRAQRAAEAERARLEDSGLQQQLRPVQRQPRRPQLRGGGAEGGALCEVGQVWVCPPWASGAAHTHDARVSCEQGRPIGRGAPSWRHHESAR